MAVSDGGGVQRIAEYERLAKEHWRGDHDEHEPPYLVYWDSTEDAWLDGFETGCRAALTDWLSRGFVVVPAKTPHKGPRAQVVTPSDGVMTREGEILAVALHAAEERELDLLAKIGRLERLIDGLESSGGGRTDA